MSEKRVAIIGAGIAGLAAGCYAQMNGFRSTIYEMHTLPGGLCTAWERKGYTFDGCLHYLFGTAPGQPFNQVWRELGALDNGAHRHDELLRVTDADGQTLIVYADPDRLASHMRALAPGDGRLITALADGIRQFADFDLSMFQAQPRTLMSADDWATQGRAILPYALPLARWGQLSAREFAQRFSDPFLRRAVVHMFGWPDVPVMVGMSLLAYMMQGNAGYPIGGSLAFAQAIARRYTALGGTIEYNAQVERILVEEDRAVGVRLYDDREIRADAVIAAADGRNTLFHLLDGRYLDRRLRRLYDGDLPLHTQVQVSLGVARDLADDPHWTIHLLDTPLRLADGDHAQIGVKQYAFDRTLAPVGKTPLVISLDSRYDYWQRIYGRRLYDLEQNQVADRLLEWLDQRVPGLTADIEVKDVATPLSYERYTGNWRGSTCGFLLTDKTMLMMIQGLPKTLPGLDNLYLAGQWVEPGGSVPVVAMSGRNAVQLLCAADRRPFRAESAPQEVGYGQPVANYA